MVINWANIASLLIHYTTRVHRKVDNVTSASFVIFIQ